MTENLKSANERKLSRLLAYLTGHLNRDEVFAMPGDNLWSCETRRNTDLYRY